MKKRRMIVVSAVMCVLMIAGTTVIANAAQSDSASDTASYSYNAGRQSAQSRLNTYSNLPEGGTKEDAQAFYEQNDVGGGAWVDGAYDESAKSSYSYMAGQQRGSSYAQDDDTDDSEVKSDYSYSTGRQSFEQSHATWRK